MSADASGAERTIRSGHGANDAVLRAGATLVLAAGIAASLHAWLTYFQAFRDGSRYNAVGGDFMVFHAAARNYLDGHLATIFDGDRLTAFINEAYRSWLPMELRYRPWVYPPSYLLLLAPFGLLGFLASYVAFQLATATALVAALVAGAKRRQSAWIIAAAALLSPAAADNIGSGQNAFLIAALLIAGFRLLDSRPVLAGMVLGLLTIKPQFALVAPIALIAAGQWRALLAAAGSALFLAAVSAAAFGVDAWTMWLQQVLSNLAASNAQWTRYGRLWGDSSWTCAILLGASPVAASVAQWTSTLFAAGTVAVVFKRRSSETARLVVILAATAFAAPYWSFYDAVLLAVAGLLWATDRPASQGTAWAWVVALALWLIPVASPPLLTPAGRLIPLVIAIFLALSMREPQADATAKTSPLTGVAPL